MIVIAVDAGDEEVIEYDCFEALKKLQYASESVNSVILCAVYDCNDCPLEENCFISFNRALRECIRYADVLW